MFSVNKDVLITDSMLLLVLSVFKKWHIPDKHEKAPIVITLEFHSIQ